jgi:molybdate transport system substrate-binding protein
MAGWPVALLLSMTLPALPDAMAGGADYGLAVMTGAPAAAYRFAMFILSDGQRMLAEYGFAAPNLPTPSQP